MESVTFLGHGAYDENYEIEQINNININIYFTVGTIGFTNNLISMTNLLKHEKLFDDVEEISIFDFINGEIDLTDKDDECNGDKLCVINDATNSNLILLKNKLENKKILKKKLNLFTYFDSISFFFLNKCGIFINNVQIIDNILFA